MAFNSLEYLEQGKVEFVYDLSQYDYNNLIKYVRENNQRINIINGFLPKLKNELPRFCYEIIYDIDEFKSDAKYLLDTYYNLDNLTKENLENLINNSSLGLSYLEDNYQNIINKYQKDLNFILTFLFKNKDKCLTLLKKLAYNTNLHIRYSFMKYLLEQEPQSINLFYDDITKYLTNENFQELEQLTLFKDYMDMEEVCNLASIIFEKNIDYNTWLKLKNFILENYQYNELAYHLLNLKKEYLSNNSYHLIENEPGIEEFNKDADTLFSTSSNYQLNILNRYSEKVSKELLDKYKQQLIYFYKNGKIDSSYQEIENYGLERNLLTYIDKYLSQSNNHTYEFLESGSTASCYRIGDYVFKLINFKWSYEEVLCPNLYLILPNLEEDYIRDDDGIVLSGIEVQKYLSRSAKNIPQYILYKFREELKKLGYYVADTLINGTRGDNCRLLDSYLDSNNKKAPDWFKEYPLVLVDRDRIYKNTNRYPKQLRQKY